MQSQWKSGRHDELSPNSTTSICTTSFMSRCGSDVNFWSVLHLYLSKWTLCPTNEIPLSSCSQSFCGVRRAGSVCTTTCCRGQGSTSTTLERNSLATVNSLPHTVPPARCICDSWTRIHWKLANWQLDRHYVSDCTRQVHKYMQLWQTCARVTDRQTDNATIT